MNRAARTVGVACAVVAMWASPVASSVAAPLALLWWTTQQFPP